MTVSTQNKIVRSNDVRIDELEAAIVSNLTPVDCPVTHMFAKGMYIREIFLPSGALVTSKIHKTEHPFTISKGKALISSGNNDWIERSAPFTGITEAGTRRVVAVLEDCTWTTYHNTKSITGKESQLSTDEQQAIVNRIEGRIIQKHENKVLNNTKKRKLWLG